MADITQLTQTGLLSNDWQTINNNFNNLNSDVSELSDGIVALQALGLSVIDGMVYQTYNI